ncbi:MAG: hypothetical protein R2723_10575 [Microbacterium sp.]
MRGAPASAARLAQTGLRLDALLSSTALPRPHDGLFGEALGLEPELDPGPTARRPRRCWRRPSRAVSTR